jgi:hypothetical protein
MWEIPPLWKPIKDAIDAIKEIIRLLNATIITMLSFICLSPKHRRSARIWSGGLILLFLISSLILPYHHHNDSVSHPDCPICISVNLPSLVNNNAPLIQSLFQGIEFISPETTIPVSKLFIDPQVPRAPPSI